MKIIDDKGRLFGKLNLLDFVIVAFIILVIGAIGIKLLQNPESYGVTSSTELEDMYVTIRCQAVTQDFIDSIEAGDKLIAQNSYTGGEVYNVSEGFPYQYTGINSEGEVVLSDHPTLQDVYITLKTEQNPDSPVFKANGQEVRIGIRMFFKTQKVEMTATVMDIDFDEPDARGINSYSN